MKFRYFKSKWEMSEAPLEAFLERTKADHFDGSELFIPHLEEHPALVRQLHERVGLLLIAQIVTVGETPEEHMRSLEERFLRAAECKPIKVNCQSGRDIFGFDANARIIERGLELSREHKVPLLFETHRSRATYSAIETRKYLEHISEMRLTADFSHWMVVHESNLKDQDENVEAAIDRSDHLHARVGHEEGPQVPHPAAPEWSTHLQNHLALWRRVAERRRAEGAEFMTITPEFGPITYMPTLPFTNQPVADAWNVNLDMKRILEDEFSSVPNQEPIR